MHHASHNASHRDLGHLRADQSDGTRSLSLSEFTYATKYFRVSI
jgi:hypothetical protein